MTIRLLSPAQKLPNEIEWVSRFLELGLPYFHLRKPTASLEEYIAYIQAIPSVWHTKIIVHGYQRALTKIFDLGGVHFRTAERERLAINFAEEVLYFRQQVAQVGTSVHTYKELSLLPPNLTYCFTSPVYPSISKAGYQSAVHWKITNIQADYPFELIALGGIDTSKISDLQCRGYSHAAVLGAIWQEHLDEKYFELLMATCQKY